MSHTDDLPTAKQLDYLRRLNRTRGVRFNAPATRAAASRQIAALKAMGGSRVDRQVERSIADAVGRPVYGPMVREDEVDGWGSSARWAGDR